MTLITEQQADSTKILQGVFGERAGHGFSTMVKIGYCHDCEWSVTPDELRDDADSLARANGLVSSRAEGHAYFNRGHRIETVYLPFDVHPDPFESDPSESEKSP